jgi:arylsulfatase A-like enzyme
VGLPEDGELKLQPGDSPPAAGYWCMRRGDWKYSDFGEGQRFLYDLKTDPEERHNRIQDSSSGDVADEMAAALHQASPENWALHRTESGQEGAPK